MNTRTTRTMSGLELERAALAADVPINTSICEYIEKIRVINSRFGWCVSLNFKNKCRCQIIYRIREPRLFFVHINLNECLALLGIENSNYLSGGVACDIDMVDDYLSKLCHL